MPMIFGSEQIFGFQAALRSPIQAPSKFRAMSSITHLDPEINRILSYWFDGPEAMKKWFGGGPQVDADIKEQFGGLVEKARAEQLSSWIAEPKGTLALVILLDQFPRNIFRGTPAAFSSDAQALKITTVAIAKDFDQQLPYSQKSFLYMPMMHDETLISQIAIIAMMESQIARCDPESDEAEYWKKWVKFSHRHRDCILHFGRFPSRNEILGRKSTPEEISYLKEYPFGF